MAPETDSTLETKRFHAVVRGRVQGVGFRQHAWEQALALGLTGYVRNLWDGSVEVIAEGQATDVDRFLAWLHEGPGMARVVRVEVHWQAPMGDFASFDVEY